MSVTVKQKFIHMPARKLRLVANLIRGKSTDRASLQLAGLPQVATEPIAKAIKSAQSAAKQQELNGPLVIAQIFIDEGPALKRRIMKSRGRASRMEHRMSHLTLTLDSAPQTEKKSNTKTPVASRKEKA